MRIGTDIDNVEMVTTDDGGRIPTKYHEFLEVFSKEKAETLPPHRPIDHAIDLESDYKPPKGWITNLSEFELKMVKAYIERTLANGFIQQSSSSGAAPILFGKKKDGGLQLCVDYRALNLGTVKNWYPLLPIPELLFLVCEAQIFTEPDLRNANHLIRIKEGDKFKAAFQTCYGQFLNRARPFGWTYALATFQAYIDHCIQPEIDDFAVCYVEDILSHSTNEKQHEDHIRKVLQCLQEFGLHCKAEKSQFGVSDVGFLGFVVKEDGIDMESDCISPIEDLPTRELVRDVQAPLGFPNFYRRFIQKYAKVMAPIWNLRKTQRSGRWEWTWDAEPAFWKLN